MINRLGQQFGKYRLVRLLGQGGFADVYLGEHILIGAPAAIKILHTQLIPTDMQAFLQEARTLVSLDHPQIVHVKDCDIAGGIPFLVMDYAPNGTLRQRHPKGTHVPFADVISYVSQVAPALQYAHDRRLIHRDVKPENMLVGRNSEVLLSDFGVAVISATSSAQQAKTSAGTATYMAPEQIFGKPCPASDQYALGIVVYEWLCGDPPFQGSFSEITAQHLHAPPPLFSEKGLTIPFSAASVIMKALAKKPEERFASVQEFALALQHSSPQKQINSRTGNTLNDQSLFLAPSDKPSQFTLHPASADQPASPGGPPQAFMSSAQQPTVYTPQNISQTMPAGYYNPAVPAPNTAYPVRRNKVGWVIAGVISMIVVIAFIGAFVFLGHLVGSIGLSSEYTPTTTLTQSTTPSVEVTFSSVATSAPDVSAATSTISTFCSDINSGNTQGAYNLTSQNYQSHNSATDFNNQFSNPNLFKGGCLYNRATASNSNVVVPLTFSKTDMYGSPLSTTNYTVTLIQDPQSGTWVIDSIK